MTYLELFCDAIIYNSELLIWCSQPALYMGCKIKKGRKLKVSRLLLNLADSIEVKWITTKLAKEYLTTGCRIVAFY